LLHDLGRAAVPNGIWEKPGTLTSGEWERVRLHAYHGERILQRCGRLAPLAEVAGMHHERLDGSGYHRGARAAALPAAARVLAAADSNPQIARELVISRRTAERHVQDIYACIGVSSRAGAALFAMAPRCRST
jgi:response regulator RpfG family c-di-GMP phosphodiesterase